MVPYKHGQIVKFLGTNGDTITSSVEVTESYIPCSGCAPENELQSVDYQLVNTEDLEFKNVANLYVSLSDSNKIITSLANPMYDFKYGGWFSFSTTNQAPYFHIDGYKYFLHKEVPLRTMVYGDILEIRVIERYPKDIDLSALYYTKEKGIIGFKHVDGLVYQLLE